jgi:hypothetical protein
MSAAIALSLHEISQLNIANGAYWINAERLFVREIIYIHL